METNGYDTSYTATNNYDTSVSNYLGFMYN